MSTLSYGCTNCSTVESFNGSLQGLQGGFGGNNNAVNHMISEQQNNMSGENTYTNDAPSIQTDQQSNNLHSGNNENNDNNYSNSNYNQPTQPMNNSYGNGNNTAQHPMNGNYNDVKVPQVMGTSAQPVQKVRARPINNTVPINNNISKEEIAKSQIHHHIKLVILVVLALATHETVKYYINHSIKFDEGSPQYFVYYTVACAVALYLAHQYLPNTKPE